MTVSRPTTTLDRCFHWPTHAARRRAASFSDSFRQDSLSFRSGAECSIFPPRASRSSTLSGEVTPHPQNSRFESWQVSFDELAVSSLQRSDEWSWGLLDNERCCSVLHPDTSLQTPHQPVTITIIIISVLIQRFNATLLHESFADENRSDDWPLEL